MVSIKLKGLKILWSELLALMWPRSRERGHVRLEGDSERERPASDEGATSG